MRMTMSRQSAPMSRAWCCPCNSTSTSDSSSSMWEEEDDDQHDSSALLQISTWNATIARRPSAAIHAKERLMMKTFSGRRCKRTLDLSRLMTRVLLKREMIPDRMGPVILNRFPSSLN